MMRFSFKKGLVFCALTKRWQLIRRLASGKLQFESEEGEIQTLEDREVFSAWLRGEWIIDPTTLGTKADVIYYATPRDLSSFPEKWQKRAKRRLHYINSINPENNKYNTQHWASLIRIAAREIGDPKPPCPSSLQKWWKQYRNTKSITNLLPKKSTGANRVRDSRYAVFEEILETVYLTSQKLPKSEVVKSIQAQITRLNQSRDEIQQIPQLGQSTIYRWINELQQDIVDGARLGAQAARVKYRTVTGSVRTEGILERIEIDHTPIDLIVIDKTTLLPVGRPWLTLAIDKHSRMVMGFYVCFNAPSTHSLLQCLKRSIIPKDEWLARFPDIKGAWPAYGIPELIAVDNGMDLHSDAFEDACAELGISILFCPAANPEAKGSVERFFRTMNQGLMHKLPGTVFSNVDERGDYPAEELAAIDMETLVHLITKWIVEVYNVSFHRGIRTTPLLKWLESSQKSVIDLPVYPQQLDVITGIPAKRTVFHYGIELEGLHYNGRQLQDIRRRAGENLQVPLKFYMDTVAYIHVFGEHAKEYIRVDAVHMEYAEELPRDAHRLIREHARRQYGDQYSFGQLTEARLAIQARINAAIKHKKMAGRKLSANLLMHDSESVLANEDPLLKAQKPIKNLAQEAPEALPNGLDDDLPKFAKLPSLNLDDGEEA